MRAPDGALLIFALAVAWSLYRAHRSGDAMFQNFNLLDLVMENGRVSRLAFVFLAGFALLSWIMVRLTVSGKMTEGYFLAYASACFAPIVAKLFSGPSAMATSTSTTSTSTTVTP